MLELLQNSLAIGISFDQNSLDYRSDHIIALSISNYTWTNDRYILEVIPWCSSLLQLWIRVTIQS